MNERQVSDYVLVLMKNLNLLIILYMAGILSASLYGFVEAGTAYDFLLEAPALPLAYWKLPLMALGLYGACLLLMSVRSDRASLVLLKACAEIVLGFLISSVLSFGYMGVILLILADTMKYFPKSRLKFPAAVVICLFYLLINYEFMSAYFAVIPVETYLSYYQGGVRSFLTGLQNALASLNTFVFLVYMLVLLWAQFNEKERILHLNQQLNQANSELQRANRQLEEYAKEEEQMAATRERNRLAREIHDTLGHALTGIITGTEACTALIDVAPQAAKEQLKAITEVARQGMTDVRRSVKALRPDALEKYDLEKAVAMTVEEMRHAAKVEIDYRCSTSLKGFSNDEEEVIYRIVQESITNSIRHGNASHIWIAISREYNILLVKIRDNGKGCTDVQKGFGLHHMEERLSLLQGELSYHGEDGFTVEARIPIRWGEMEEQND